MMDAGLEFSSCGMACLQIYIKHSLSSNEEMCIQKTPIGSSAHLVSLNDRGGAAQPRPCLRSMNDSITSMFVKKENEPHRLECLLPCAELNAGLLSEYRAQLKL